MKQIAVICMYVFFLWLSPDTAFSSSKTSSAEIKANLKKQDEAIYSHIPKMLSCYKETLQKEPALTGHIRIDFDVNEKLGQVTSANVNVPGSTISHAGLQNCILGIFKKMILPPLGGGRSSATYPVFFELDGQSQPKVTIP